MPQDKVGQLKELAVKVLEFSDSDLYKIRKQNDYQPVFGEGDSNAQVILVGEAPGKQEAKTGRPFVGRAGRVLDELLESVGVRRDQVYITNIVKDRPPKNRNPSAKETDLYMPFLSQQLLIIEPAVIVTLGLVATKTLLRHFDLPYKDRRLGDLHGVPVEAHAEYGDVTLLPLYHPAAGFYNPDIDSIMRNDIQALKKLLNS